MQEMFFEGFKSNTLSSNNYKGVYGANIGSSLSGSTSKSSSKDFDDKNGHWITTKNGNHVFIEDEKSGKKSKGSSSKTSSNKGANSQSKSTNPNKMKGNPTGGAASVKNKSKNTLKIKEKVPKVQFAKNSIEQSIENVVNMYDRNSKLQEQDVKIIIEEINKLDGTINNLKGKPRKEQMIIIFQNADNNQKQKMLELGIGNLYSKKQLGIYENVKDFSGPDTAGMLDLAHGENKMNDKSYIKDTIKIQNFNDESISSDKDYWKSKIEGQFGRDGFNIEKIPGYFFKNNSEPSIRLSENKDLKNILKKHKNEILKGENFSDEFPQYGNDLISKISKENNFKNAFGKVDFRHPHIDNKGRLHVIMCDTYDSNNEDNILIQAGRRQMLKGNLKPFFTIHEIIISKNETDKILK